MMKYINKKRLPVLGLITTLFLSACNPWAEDTKGIDPVMKSSIMEVLKSVKGTETFVSLLEATHYDDVLERAQAYTVFAPENSAWPADMSNFDTLEYIKNHIAWQTYPIVDNSFGVDKIQMINGKYLPVAGKTVSVDDIALKTINQPAQNGIVHTIGTLIEPRMNIWEYLNKNHSDYMPVKVFNDCLDSVMDMDLSYQLYLDDDGRPVYDTAWTYVNEWLNAYALDNEDSSYTFIIVSDETVESLGTLYRPYFLLCDYDAATFSMVENVAKTDALLKGIITQDMILPACRITAAGGDYYSKAGVKVTPGNVDEVYQASNGYVYVLTDLDVKIYENKVKTQYLEAEDYYSVNSSHGVADVSKRVKSYARSGFDIMLSTIDYFSNTGTTDNDSKNHYSTLINSNFEYRPVLNSVPYKMYAMCYDDTYGSIASGDTLDLTYKLLASLPSAPVLTSSNGVFSKNFNDTVVYVVQNNARTFEEQAFSMWATTHTTNMYASYPLIIHPDYPAVDQLPCGSYGEAVLKLSNCALSSTVSTIYMDYIKLVPVIDSDK